METTMRLREETKCSDPYYFQCIFLFFPPAFPCKIILRRPTNHGIADEGYVVCQPPKVGALPSISTWAQVSGSNHYDGHAMPFVARVPVE